MGNEASVCGPKSINLGPGPIDYSVSADLGYTRADASSISVQQQTKKGFPAQISQSGRDLLHKAASSGSMAILERLILQKEVPVDCPDNKGNTALHKAAWHGKLEAVRMLVKHGAKLGLANASGKTALAFAKQMGHDDSAEYLLEMMQRHSPEKIKSMFRSKGKTSNCAKVYGPRQSMRATAWLIPGAPDVAEVLHDQRIVSHAISTVNYNQHTNAPVTSPAQPRVNRSPSAHAHMPSPQVLPVRARSASANAITPAPSSSNRLSRTATHPGPTGQRSHQAHFSNQDEASHSPSGLPASPPMPKLDLSGLQAASQPADEEVLSGRSTSRREEMPQGMWAMDKSTPTPSGLPLSQRTPSDHSQARTSSAHSQTRTSSSSYFPSPGSMAASPRMHTYAMPVSVERVVQGAGGMVSVVQVAQRPGRPPVMVSPSFAFV